MFWTTEAAKAPSGKYCILMKEWELNESGGYDLTDVDEPVASSGMDFDSLSDLLEFAKTSGLKISNVNVY